MLAYPHVTDRPRRTNLAQLREVADRAGWDIVQELVDEGVSGSKGRDKRPAFDELCKAATRREIDVVMAWSVDRLGRSLQHLVSFLGTSMARSGPLSAPAGHRHNDTWREGTFQMMGVFAEFERAIIRERINAGLQRARAQGKKLGRPKVSQRSNRQYAMQEAKAWG